MLDRSYDSGHVTLIIRELEKKWWSKEHPLNTIAAFVTRSNFSHIEVAIGDRPGHDDCMTNVLRIYNDTQGVELCERTGRSPTYKYLQIGCSKRAERAMLHFAIEQVGKPFSMSAMARSVVYPRTTDYKNYYCAELVAACLQAGGLMSIDSNPGSATPQSIYAMYAPIAALSGNPYTLRNISKKANLSKNLSTHFPSNVSSSTNPRHDAVSVSDVLLAPDSRNWNCTQSNSHAFTQVVPENLGARLHTNNRDSFCKDGSSTEIRKLNADTGCDLSGNLLRCAARQAMAHITKPARANTEACLLQGQSVCTQFHQQSLGASWAV